MKTKYEKLGTIDITVADIAFLGNMFAVTNYIGRNPDIMAGKIDLIGDLAQMVVAGKESPEFVNALGKLEKDNHDVIHQFRVEHADESSGIAANMMLTSILSSEDGGSSLEAMLMKMMSKSSEMEGKREVRPNAPETGYQ